MDNRYYFSEIHGEQVILTGGEAQHISRVRRCREGDRIVAFNGDGYDYSLVIDEVMKDKVIASVISKQINKAYQDTDITVYLAMLKNDALSTAIDHLAELNVKSVKLFKSDYTIAVIDDKKLDKLKSIATQASKQCERADIMDISIIDKKDIEKDISRYDNRFFAFEDSDQKISSFTGDFAVIIGPEGGFSREENEHFSRFCQNISLGKTILRAEVACISAVSMLKAVKHES
ncbi:MAG: 16S rRNA (uracil(1498)-N(3))-methyltransferase [Clostridiales bacterium]|nr:16S rRNA (uracil(1498)-N(3))-methyltransferase [Clostridiales bacterium]